MAVDVETLVKDQLDPVLTLDSTISTVISRAIEAQSALHDFGTSPTDDQKVLLSLYVLRSLIPRLTLKFALKVKEVKSVKAGAKYDRAVQYLELLAENIENEIAEAKAETSPEDLLDVTNFVWPGIGPVEWESPDD